MQNVWSGYDDGEDYRNGTIVLTYAATSDAPEESFVYDLRTQEVGSLDPVIVSAATRCEDDARAGTVSIVTGDDSSRAIARITRAGAWRLL